MANHPYMDVGLRRWIASYARENHWRVARWIELEDLIQEGYFCYAKVVRKYPGLARRRNPTRNNRKVFMALVKTAFTNHIHDLSYERGPEKNIASCLLPDDNHDDWLANHGASEGAVAELCAVLGTARELTRLLKVLHSDAADGVEYLKVRVGKHYRRENNIEYVCRRAGFDLKKKPKRETANEYVLRCLGLDYLSKSVDIIEVLGHHFGVKVTR